jgi:hypothetical protein
MSEIAFYGECVEVALEIVKIAVSILFGGMAGAILNDWRRRADSRVQSIPLIERVNRLVNPALDGITLARAMGDGDHRQLEELKNLREYQLTLRNTSTVHLQDAEILFEFPAKDVQAWASRPTLSKTALISVNATPTDPWKKAFRWSIPHLPSGDSVEFTFRAVDPPSDSYEVALYKSERIIVGKVVGEPAPKRKLAELRILILVPILAACITAILWMFGYRFVNPNGEAVTTVRLAGCDLRVVSIYDVYGKSLHSPFKINHRVFNAGVAPCYVLSDRLDSRGSFTIEPGVIFEKEVLSENPPELAEFDASVGTAKTAMEKTHIKLYFEK